jgi:hypothetical protein
MTVKKNGNRDGLDESLRRLGGILASPGLVMSYEHTTPLLERAWLRRLGLDRAEQTAFLDLLCRHGLLDTGARAVIEDLCRRRGISPEEAAHALLAGEGWPDKEEDDG